MIPSKKRHISNTQDAEIDQSVREERWYALKHDEVVVKVEDLCDTLIASLSKHAHIDPRFQNAINSANSKRKLPDTKRCSIAVLGEQGIGKSTVINALLDRALLDRSGASKACTAYATILEYKNGAPDQTHLSDVSVEFLIEEETRHCIKEQIDRWTEVYPGPQKSDQPLQNQDGNEENDENDEEGDEEDSNNADEDDTTHAPIKKVSKAACRAAATAKEFFWIIFNAHEHTQKEEWLELAFHHTNIKEGDFSNLCLQHAMDRLSAMAVVNEEIDLSRRKTHFKDVPDNKLKEKTMTIKKLWPLVKVVTIATGHILLRHGLRFFDLPGYGDTSQLREAVVNNFRRQSDFEMVVAPFSRLQTSVLQERYINWFIHLKGANKTILVMNKSDTLINDDNMGTQICEIKEHPFPSLHARLGHVEALADQDNSSEDTIADLMEEIMREATIAYIKHETANVQKKMQPKGVKVFSVSALAHNRSRKSLVKHTEILNEKTAGILELRYFLAKLSGATNYQNYYDHVFEVLPRLRNEAARPLERHLEDKTYAEMRGKLIQRIPQLRKDLKSLSRRSLDELVGQPWSTSEEQDVTRRIEKLVNKRWVQPFIYHPGFAKMLRENGIPVNGKYYGHNLNYDLLGTMEEHHDRWYDNMYVKTQDLAEDICKPVQRLLCATLLENEKSSADPGLKSRAAKELHLVQQRIDWICDTLHASLRTSLVQTRLRFTTEIDIECPIAVAMKACYDRALDPELIHSGSGTYSRQHKVICKSIINPPGTALGPLLDTIKKQIQTEHRQRWKVDCNDFIDNAVNSLYDFSYTAERLLRNPSYMTVEHKQARDELKKILTEFDTELKHIQDRFVSVEGEHIAKKTRREGFGGL